MHSLRCGHGAFHSEPFPYKRRVAERNSGLGHSEGPWVHSNQEHLQASCLLYPLASPLADVVEKGLPGILKRVVHVRDGSRECLLAQPSAQLRRRRLDSSHHVVCFASGGIGRLFTAALSSTRWHGDPFLLWAAAHARGGNVAMGTGVQIVGPRKPAGGRDAPRPASGRTSSSGCPGGRLEASYATEQQHEPPTATPDGRHRACEEQEKP
mmetsp:Transcript_8904/g.32832  ORF Transcript_8904/g.32832 Transcript_8904/m.32832 type:complete len:210 (-) Transcript_8904:34-663(-)|eukprot:scaffold926_cov408-Prasinococcus_capsulatus_cf.AAC.51